MNEKMKKFLKESLSKKEQLKISKLTKQEKEKALISYNEMRITTVMLSLFVFIFTVFIFVYGVFNFKDFSTIIIFLSSILIPIIGLVIYLFLKPLLFPNWYKYYKIVENGFDGLPKKEMDKLKPTEKELKEIKIYNIKNIIAAIIFVGILMSELLIFVSIQVDVSSPLPVVIVLLTSCVWYIYYTFIKTEIYRLESGYYKKK